MRVTTTAKAVLSVLGLLALNAIGAEALRAAASSTKENNSENDANSAKALAVISGNDDRRGPSGKMTRRERYLEERREEIEGMEELQRQFRELNGRDFTQEELQEAIDRAHKEAGKRGSDGFPTNRHLFMEGVPKHERRRHLEEHNAREQHKASRRMQTIRKADGFIVSNGSPGFIWNKGRNEFFCAAVPKVAENQRNTRRRQKMTLKNCYTTPADELITKYTDDSELWMKEIDTVFYDWCLGSSKVRKNKPVWVDWCDVYDENQLFDLLSTDNTWRPAVDITLCVTCNGHDCATGGGKLKYKPCSTELRGNNKYRNGQSFTFCFLGTSCTIDRTFNRIDCLIDERCGAK